MCFSSEQNFLYGCLSLLYHNHTRVILEYLTDYALRLKTRNIMGYGHCTEGQESRSRFGLETEGTETLGLIQNFGTGLVSVEKI